MTIPPIKTAIWDIETDGLLDTLTRVHILGIRDYERRITYCFRRNDEMDTIDQGLDLLENAELVVGHNILDFDIPALDKVYTGVDIKGRIMDTLVMSRMVFANQKEKDFRLYEKGKLEGKLIGQHNLKAWGQRLGFPKGDYADVMAAKAKAAGLTLEQDISKFVWGTWNQEMEDYCIRGDINITAMLFEKVQAHNWARPSITLEHEIHDLMGQQARNGIPFDVEAAERLEADLLTNANLLEKTLVDHFGRWWKPEKKYQVKLLWDDPDGVNASKTYAQPRSEFTEDRSRAVWGEVTVPTKRRVMKKGTECPTIYDPDAPYCKIQWQEFNPNSRPQIIDRLTTVYDWHPVDFTEKGNPEVSDDVLRKLKHVPMAEELAELFYYKKRLGQVSSGKGAWLKKVTDEGRIHAYVNVGGTISGRASHVDPNLAQVPKVKKKKRKNPDGTETSYIPKGRDGDHGWECRSLFYVPEEWGIMIGADLEGIELRCFGELLSRYDGGAYLEIVLSRDIHAHNQDLAELPTRDNAKTFIYALIYGAGDIKLGSIVSPLADEEEQRQIGAKLRKRFMDNLPAYAQVVKQIQRWAKEGFLPGLDGRKLYVRSPHSALNTKLQSDAALIAKKWVLLTRDRFEDMGWRQGWDGDFVNLLWIHDEQQSGLRHWSSGENRLEIAKLTMKEAAAEAGRFFGYKCPISADAKHGHTWAETH